MCFFLSFFLFSSFVSDNFDGQCRLYNNVLSLTKERFPLLRFILADVPFQNMSLNEQYSDEEQRSSKHENSKVSLNFVRQRSRLQMGKQQITMKER